ncbi:DciA family protein [Streptomyces sp. NPDC058665]|uniref:DciA family protein n=1 Tax=Streptomyces sp. NPDC058665 TaxID=3346586 RepID=UPI0036661DD0
MTETSETTTPTQQPDDGSPEMSGVNLARVALHQALQDAKKRGHSEARAPRRKRKVKRDGREPNGFAAVLAGLMANRAWELPAAGGTVLDRWPDIAATVAPRLPDHVQAVAFHPDTGQLDLRPDSPAYGTQLRLIGARIVIAANETTGASAVRSVRVLPVGAAPAPAAKPAPEAPTAPGDPQAPVKTRETASPGFHQALAAHQSVVPAQRLDPGIAEAVERQTRAMRELSRRAFPKTAVAVDDAPAPIEATRAQRRRDAAATEAAALRRARAERAQRAAGTAASTAAAQPRTHLPQSAAQLPNEGIAS